MKKKLILLLFIFVACKNYGQEKEKSNPIIYLDISLTGVSSGKGGGNNFSTTFNYQKGINLFTYKYTVISEIKGNNRYFLLFLPFSSFSALEPNKAFSIENSLLYGKRFIKKDFSYSFSLGVSLNRYYKVIEIESAFFNSFESTYLNNAIGVPFEFQIHWIKPKKRIRKFLELFPYGKPTGFGGAIGIKLFGNVSQKSYIGFGLTYGFGYYKKY